MALVVAAVTAALIGCAATRNSESLASPPGSPSERGPVSSPETTIPITITIDGQKLTGSLSNQAASRSLAEQLPLTLDFSDFGGQEKIAKLPVPLSLDGLPSADDADPMTIGYYAPEQSLVLYYKHVGRFTGIVRLGTLDNFAPEDFRSSFSAIVEHPNS